MSETGVSETRASIARVFKNPNLRRLQLAYLGSNIGGWAYATALTVWAYGEGGAAAVGAFTAVRFIAMAVAGPLGAVISDRVSRKALMLGSDGVSACLVASAALAIGLDAPAIVVYALGVLVSMVGAPFRSAQAGLIPRLVSTPGELTASNAVASNIENVSCFAGPALGALLIGVTDVQTVFWLNVATFTWSFVLVAAVRVPASRDLPAAAADELVEEPGFLSTITAGFRTVARDRDLRMIGLLAAAQGFIWGTLTVFLVLIAIRTLDTGAHGVGYLNAVLGIGTVFGGLIILTRVSKGRLAQDMGIGVLGWSLPLLLLAASPSPVTAIVAIAVIGLMDPWVNLGFDTIPQRIAPDAVLSRVFAAIEAALIAAMSLGAFVVPTLIDWLGFRGALTAIGVVVSAYALSRMSRLRRLDARLAEPAEVPLLRRISIFAPLPAPTIELLARKLEHVSYTAGQTVVREGESSDHFYVIGSGEVEVTQGGVVLRREQAGDFFGEIGLLRDVPRTATVTALTDTELLALQRQDFLEAVTGEREARRAAEDIVSRRLGV